MVEFMNEVGDQKDRAIHTDQLEVLKAEGYRAIESEDQVLLSSVIAQLKELKTKILFSNPATWLFHFNRLIREDHMWISEKEAQYYLQKGQRAIEAGDMAELQRCVRSLWLLLPVNEQQVAQDISGITN